MRVYSDTPDSVILRNLAWFSGVVMAIGFGIYALANSIA